MNLIIISGLSGSGKSVALHTLEDLDYYCIDNLPIGLLSALAQELVESKKPIRENAAVGIDARNQSKDLCYFPERLQRLKDDGINAQIWFLQADQPTLLKRYSETRRKHPIAGRDVSLADAINRERELLEPIAEQADMYIDTTHTNVYQLRDLVRDRVADQTPDTFSLLFQSFGYKRGIPADADFVFDVRCLPNPHWEPQLRPLTGLDQPVIEYLGKQSLTEDMFGNVLQFLETWIPRFQDDNRSYMTVAIGCTGGQHRSVFLADRLAKHFRAQYPNVLIRHRELP